MFMDKTLVMDPIAYPGYQTLKKKMRESGTQGIYRYT